MESSASCTSSAKMEIVATQSDTIKHCDHPKMLCYSSSWKKLLEENFTISQTGAQWDMDNAHT